jgi:penicillin-binding protein 2
MINNNVLDLTRFSSPTATETEQKIYSKFTDRQAIVNERIMQELTMPEPKALSQLSEEYNTYLSHIYDKLTNDGIINTKAIDKEDDTYVSWKNETISLQQFLYYAISKNWIQTSMLYEDDEIKYSGSDEIYQKLLEYIIQTISTETAFSKKIYSYLVDEGVITGTDICLALFDQGVLAYDEAAYNRLKSGASAYEFMKEQIRQIKITPAQIALDPCSGSLVVTDVNSGDVLALVTYPSYDNNMLSGTVDSKYWKKLNNDLSLPLYNRATQTRTAPGSTFKMVSAITGLEEGLIGAHSTIHATGIFTKVDPSPKCWRYPGSHGSINVSQALSVSCNYFFYDIGYRLCLDGTGTYNNEQGLSTLKNYATMLGLTTPSGVEIIENDPLFSTIDTVRSAIGQGSNSFTNVQLARYTTTLASKGNNYDLTLIDKIVDSVNNTTTEHVAEVVNKVELKESTWKAVFEGMRSVITSGTAKGTFNGFKIEVAGKSGTAQENKLRSNHSVFVAYAPYTNPEIGLSVVLPNGESSGYNAEVIRDVIKYYYHLTTDEELYGGVASIPTSGVTAD